MKARCRKWDELQFHEEPKLIRKERRKKEKEKEEGKKKRREKEALQRNTMAKLFLVRPGFTSSLMNSVGDAVVPATSLPNFHN